MSRWLFWVLLLGAVASGCASDPASGPGERAVVLQTDGCGDAGGTTGSGLLLSEDRVLTAAHVVIGSSSVRVTMGEAEVVAEVIDLDIELDLALLMVPGGPGDIDDPVFGDAVAGDTVQLYGAADSGDVVLEVLRRASIGIEAVRDDERVRRDGYEMEGLIGTGDSGAGVWLEDELVGVVFARSTERDGIAFAVSADEIEAFLDTTEAKQFVCDPDESKLVPSNT